METLGKASLGMIFYKQLCTDFWRGVRQEGDIKKILETNIIEFLKSTFGKRCSIRSCFSLFLFFCKGKETHKSQTQRNRSVSAVLENRNKGWSILKSKSCFLSCSI